MSSNATDTGSLSQSSFEALIRPSLNSVMITHTFLTLLIPLVIALFYFSTPQSRRRPIFSLNLVAIFIAFVEGILVDAFGIHTILEPLNPWPLAFNIVIGFIIVSQSIVVDLTLLVRLITVYPPGHVGRVSFALLIAIPVLLKLSRVVNIILFTKAMVDAMNGPDAAVMMQIVFATKPYLKVEWAAQMIDNTYASVAFLWKMRYRGNGRVMTNASRMTLSQSMQTLFKIALTNFVVPAVFSIAQFVCVYRGVNVYILNQLVIVNTMVATFGVVFATVWAGSMIRHEVQILDSKRNNTSSHLMAIFGLGAGRTVNRSSIATVADPGSIGNSRDEIKV